MYHDGDDDDDDDNDDDNDNDNDDAGDCAAAYDEFVNNCIGKRTR